MDTKTFNTQLASALGQDARRTADMIDAFASVLKSCATTMTTIAVPSFGSFVPTKADEEIITDHVSGKRVLLPPQITVEFQPAASLRKKLGEQ